MYGTSTSLDAHATFSGYKTIYLKRKMIYGSVCPIRKSKIETRSEEGVG